jgi:S-DNA-T family DNA segregation ATPase FtsK/SpoIIIE
MAQKQNPSKLTSSRQAESQESKTWSDIGLKIWIRFERFAWDVGGVTLLAIAVMTLLALLLPQLAGGKLLVWWTDILRRWFGWGSLFIVVATGVLGLVMLRWRMDNLSIVRWRRVFALEGVAFIALTLMTLLGGGTLERAEAGLDGGVVGWGLAELLNIVLPSVVSIFLLIFLLIVFLIMGLGLEKWLSSSISRFLVGDPELDIDDLTDPAN